jgi:signal transduction histidine kinase
MLMNEAKAEQEFLTMINATVSHELRNPLNALISQVCMLNIFLNNFKVLLQTLKSQRNENKSELIEQFESLMSRFSECCIRIDSAAKLIDFFVHDILDYTILNKKAENFMKNNSIFEVRKAVDEILMILEDKITMKKIKIKTTYNGFIHGFGQQVMTFVKTDQKRLQ